MSQFGCDKPGGRPLSPERAAALTRAGGIGDDNRPLAVCWVRRKKDKKLVAYKRKGEALRRAEKKIGKPRVRKPRNSDSVSKTQIRKPKAPRKAKPKIEKTARAKAQKPTKIDPRLAATQKVKDPLAQTHVRLDPRVGPGEMAPSHLEHPPQEKPKPKREPGKLLTRETRAKLYDVMRKIDDGTDLVLPRIRGGMTMEARYALYDVLSAIPMQARFRIKKFEA